MTLGLDQHGRTKQARQLVRRGSLAQWRPQVERVITEEAEPQAAVRRQPYAIAALAIIVRERADDPDRAGRAG